ncbi:hypothetical protein Pint_11428 [Pistacia integerrima]|uniref:Uncharacterized protein n=1 Tax=Pistacia integerrima TaxID=434235 RepID=A0ACC0XFX8_9ROSI|nr:hypothetical protein Pint_11428 [Pistacia integerrima]
MHFFIHLHRCKRLPHSIKQTHIFPHFSHQTNITNPQSSSKILTIIKIQWSTHQGQSSSYIQPQPPSLLLLLPLRLFSFQFLPPSSTAAKSSPNVLVLPV